MVKITTTLVLLLLLAETARSQALIAILFGGKVKNQHLSFGVVVGATDSWISGADAQKVRIGLGIGAYTAYNINSKWEACMYIVAKSPKGSRSLPYDNSFVVPEDTALVGTDFKRFITYISVAPLIRYRLSPSFAVGLGPQGSLRAKATDLYEHDSDQGKLSYKYDPKDYIHRIDGGAVFDLQYTLMKGKGMRINVQYYWGMGNLYKDNPAALRGKNQQVLLAVGIPIGIHAK